MRRADWTFKGILLPAAVLVLAVFALYYPALGYGFVYDDAEQVLRNRWVLSIANIPEAFSTHTFGFKAEGGHQAISYRPMFFVAYMFAYAIFGFAAWGWHLLNLLAHSLNAVLAFLIFRHLIQTERPGQTSSLTAFAAALVFAVHPMNAEAVSWVATMSELTFTALCLTAFLLEARSMDVPGRCSVEAAVSRALPPVFFLAAVLIKETAVVLPLIVFVYDLSRRAARPFFTRERVLRFVPYAAALMSYTLMRAWALRGEMTPTERLHAFLTPYEFILNAFWLLARYFKSLVLPIGEPPLQLMDPVLSASDPRAMIGVVAALAVPVVLALVLRKMTRSWLLVVALTVLPVLPTLYSPAVSRFPFADRYLYLPSVGFSMGLAVTLAWVFYRRPGLGRLGAAALIVLCVPALMLARHRSSVWASDGTLWGAALRAQPENYVAVYSVGVEHFREGRAAEALELFERSLQMNLSSAHPDQSMVLLARKSLPQAAASAGREDRAEEHLKEYLALVPDDAIALYNLGYLMRKKGLCPDAADLFERAAVFSREARLDAMIYSALGDCYLEMGMRSKALAALREGLRKAPGDGTLAGRIESMGEAP